MKPQTLLLMVVALGCGLAAMVMTNRFLGAPQATENTDNVSVVVAVAQLQPGTIINETMVKTKVWPKSLAPAEHFTDVKELVGRAIRYHLGVDEVITMAKLAPEGVQSGIETVIEDGMRAMSVGITSERSVAGFVKPGSRVDILLTVSPSGPQNAKISKTILQDVKVLAVNTNMQTEGDPDNKGKSVEMVTFQVDPDQAEALAVAQGAGQLSLVLRSSIDDKAVKTKGFTIDQLLARKGDLNNERADQPDAVVLKDKEEEGTATGLFGALTGVMKKNAEPKPEPESAPPVVQIPQSVPVAPPSQLDTTAVAAQVPGKKLKRLVYRDPDGNHLMEVMLDAESKIAESLHELLEDVEAEKNAANNAPPQGRRPTSPQQAPSGRSNRSGG